MTGSLTEAVQTGVVVLDGGLATELERRGHDLGSALWSARLLAEDPTSIRSAHDAYFAAGAQLAIAASYQASYEGMAAAGHDAARADALLRRSVRLAREAAADRAVEGWVAASVGPYGAMLAGGQEYTGDYGADVDVDRLRQWHRRRLSVLASAEPDVLALETVPNLAEAEALLTEVGDLGVPAWLSLSCTGTTTRLGEPAREAFLMARDVASVIAVGINCTDPHDVAELVAVAAEASGKPVVAYPNSGETWDAATRSWTGSPDFDADQVDGWMDRGARLVGGCCRVAPDQIAALAAQVQARSSPVATP